MYSHGCHTTVSVWLIATEENVANTWVRCIRTHAHTVAHGCASVGVHFVELNGCECEQNEGKMKGKHRKNRSHLSLAYMEHRIVSVDEFYVLVPLARLVAHSWVYLFERFKCVFILFFFLYFTLVSLHLSLFNNIFCVSNKRHKQPYNARTYLCSVIREQPY